MNTKYIIYSLIFTMSVLTLSCGEDNIDPAGPTALDLQLEALRNNNNAWSLEGGSVVKDGYDVSGQFAGFKLSIGEFTYTSQNGLASAWPSSGTWSFVNGNVNKIMREDGVEIDLSLTSNTLILKFNVTGLGGRVSGLDGGYTFTLENN